MYGDCVEEIDGSVGLIVKAVQRLGLSKNTLIAFFSDNGPAIFFKAAGGSAGPFFGGKGQTYEGGVRVPSIWNWPGKINPNTQDHSITSIPDIFTTLASIAGASIPTDRPIDGMDLSKVLFEDQALERECIAYYTQELLTAVRCGAYKLHYYAKTQMLGYPAPVNPPALYNLHSDPGEHFPLNNTHFIDVIAKIDAWKAAWLESVVLSPGQFQLYNMTADAYQPCCNIETNCYCPPSITVQPSYNSIRQAHASAAMASESLEASGYPSFGPTNVFI